jgi:hypothetical protein
MKCLEFEQSLCDFLDHALDVTEERAMEAHARGCARCAEELADARLVLGVMREAPAVDPPPQLIAEIIHETIGVGVGQLEPAGGGRWSFLWTLFHPFGQPRFVMGMAMTMLSFSMFTFYGQRAIDEWKAAEPSPTATLVEDFSRDVIGLWKSASEIATSAVAFYELQTGGAEADAPVAEPAPANEKPEGAR